MSTAGTQSPHQVWLGDFCCHRASRWPECPTLQTKRKSFTPGMSQLGVLSLTPHSVVRLSNPCIVPKIQPESQCCWDVSPTTRLKEEAPALCPQSIRLYLCTKNASFFPVDWYHIFLPGTDVKSLEDNGLFIIPTMQRKCFVHRNWIIIHCMGGGGVHKETGRRHADGKSRVQKSSRPREEKSTMDLKSQVRETGQRIKSISQLDRTQPVFLRKPWYSS